MTEYKYRIRFYDGVYGDWTFTLFTTEPKTQDEIESLIDYWAEVNGRNKEEYTPVDIMDDIVADHDGWRWGDGDEELLIVNW
jgi:hypothetical protein